MRTRPKALWMGLWPGLPRLWHGGNLKSLAVAVGFAVVLNAVLIGTFVQPQRPPAALTASVWIFVGSGWLCCLLRAWWLAARHGPSANPKQDLFITAQAEYLRGHWYEAQTILERSLRTEPGDVESHLMLATLLRRSGRLGPARQRLERLRRMESARPWRLEIDRERSFLDRLEQEKEQTEPADGSVASRPDAA